MSTGSFENGLVHVYTGDGKGKTTTALGLALRALGWGARVCMVQFIKGYPDIGEARFAREMGNRFIVRQFAKDHKRAIGEESVLKRREAARRAMEFAQDVVSSGEFDLVILDEINNAMHYGLIEVEQTVSLIEQKPKHVELVLTGRSAPEQIIAVADYVTRMEPVKHPYESNIPARRGIDY